MALLPRTAALLTTVTQCRGLSQRAGARYLLVDGHNLIYRAFYAMPQLSRSGDRPVGAVMGVANTFLKLALPYSRVVFCLDPKGPGWREELFATAWKSTGELGYCKRPCQPSRHRADAVTRATPRRWRVNSTPSRRRSDVGRLKFDFHTAVSPRTPPSSGFWSSIYQTCGGSRGRIPVTR